MHYVQRVCKMAAPTSFTLVKTVNLIYQNFEPYDIAVDEHTVFHEPRISSLHRDKCDLCFPIISDHVLGVCVPSVILFPKHHKCKIKLDIDKLQKELPVVSKSWTLPIKSCSVASKTFCILLDRAKSFQNTIAELLSNSCPSAFGIFSQAHVVITTDSSPSEESTGDLTQLRTFLAYQSLCNIFRLLGYHIKPKSSTSDSLSFETKKYHVCYKTSCTEKNPDFSLIYCGAVLDKATGVKASDINAQDYYKIKRTAFEKTSQGRENAADSINHITSLSEAEVCAELLWVKLHDHVSIDLSQDPDKLGARSATFLLYNHVRLSSIRKKFMEKVKCGSYESLPSIEEINFGLLTQDEEWEILLLVLQFPYWLVSCVSPKGNFSLHPLLIGMDKLCRVFSVYYRRVRILTEARPHLMPVMYARIYLLQCVEHIIGVGLSIFKMKPLDYM